MIARVPVQSSHVAEVGYDDDFQILEVAYKDANGEPTSVYQYAGVPRNEWARLWGEGASIGRIINEIKRAPGVIGTKLAEVEA